MDNESANSSAESPPGSVPGVQDSAILLMDSCLTLLRLGKAEAAQALATLPQLLSLALYRLPALVLTWISFVVLVACSVYAFTESPVLTAGSFFLMQVGLTLVLEQRSRLLQQRLEFTETRKGLTVLQASLKERFQHEAG